MDTEVRKIIQAGDALFSARQQLMTYWQCVAENFYPERADFTTTRALGDEFADHLSTSYPIIARRELGDQLSAMLRPRNEEWFAMKPEREDRIDSAGRRWLDWASGTQRRAMYDINARFARATKEGDHDYAGFGQCVISVEIASSGAHFLYRNWHLRDVAWRENSDCQIDEVHRNWKPTARDLEKLFPGKTHRTVKEAAGKSDECHKEIKCRHVIVPSSQYTGQKKWKQPFVSLHIDCENEHVMEEAGVWKSPYVIPRWQTVSGSQYAYSPAAVAALPDARLIQAMTLTLLDAGEWAAAPPMIAKKEAIKGDVDLRSRGITWVDLEFDEDLKKALSPVDNDYRGLTYGLEMHNDTREMIAQAFYLNKLRMLPQDKDMTAFEVGQHVQSYIRDVLPLFEPIEMDYNGALCEATFDLGMRVGLFGPYETIPDSLKGQQIQWRFVSPLSDAVERKDAARFMEARGLLATAAEIELIQSQSVSTNIYKADEALELALKGVSTPAKLIRDDAEMAEISKQRQAQAETQALTSAVAQGASVAKDVGEAAQALQGS